MLGTPTLLVNQGQVLSGRLQRQRVTEDELDEACREHGVADPADCSLVVLEVDGSLSVVPRSRPSDHGVTSVAGRAATAGAAPDRRFGVAGRPRGGASRRPMAPCPDATDGAHPDAPQVTGRSGRESSVGPAPTARCRPTDSETP